MYIYIYEYTVFLFSTSFGDPSITSILALEQIFNGSGWKKITTLGGNITFQTIYIYIYTLIYSVIAAVYLLAVALFSNLFVGTPCNYPTT